MRIVAVLWCVVSAAAGSVLGAGGAAWKTDAGRHVAVQEALRFANRHLHGRLSVGLVGGSWLGGLDARDVVLSDSAGAPVVRLARLGASYDLNDLAGGRITLGQVTIDTPVVHLVERPSGRLNLEEVLGIGAVGGPAGPSPLIAFRDVVIRDGQVDLRTRLSPGDSAPVVDSTSAGRFRVRHITGLTATLPYVRLASPLPRDVGIRVDIQRLAARLSDPALDIRGAQGTIGIRGDTIALDLGAAKLPRTTARVRGALVNASRGLGLDLTLQVASGASEDVQGLAPQLPAGVDGHGTFVVRQPPGGTLSLTAEPVTLAGRDDGGRAAGRLAVVIGAGRSWGMRDTRLTLDRFDLSYLRAFLDTLPIEGRVTGTFGADGDQAALTTSVDIAFRDSLVADHPVTTVQGDGLIHLRVPDGVVFERFSLRAGHFELGTVRRLVPSVHLMGALDAAGTVDGAWRNLSFSGTMRHRDAGRPPSLARGVVRLDTRRDTVGVWATMQVDSLDLTGIASELRGVPIRGAYSGDVELAGYVDSLDVHLDVTGPAGAIVGGGLFSIVPGRTVVRDLDFLARDLDLQAVDAAWPASRITGRLVGQIALDSGQAPRASLHGTLGRSMLGGSMLDSGRAGVTVRDSLVHSDSLHVWGPGDLDADMRGSLRLAGDSHDDSLLIHVNTDSLGLAAPLLVTLAPGLGEVPDTVAGAITVVAAVLGSLETPVVRGAVAANAVRWGVATVRGVRVIGQWSRDADAPISLRADARALLLGRFTYTRPLLTIEGKPDSLAWRGRSSLGADASWTGAGRWLAAGDSLAIPVDSLVLQLPDQAWRLDRAARVIVRDSAVELSHITLRPATGAGELSVSGRHPRLGTGDVRATLTAVPLSGAWALLQRDPAQVGGTVTGTLTFTGALHAPVLSANVTLRDGRFSDFTASRVTAVLDYHELRLGGALDLYKDSARVMDVTLDLPLDLALASVPQRQVPGPLMVHVRTDSLDLGVVEALSQNLRRASGRLRADASVRGSWDAPELSGTVDVTNAATTLPALGTRYEDVFAHLALAGDTIRVDSLVATSDKGTATVRGSVRLVELTRPMLDLAISADRFQAIDARNFLSVTASGDLALTGPAIGARLTGHATVTKGVLYFADLITKNVVNLDVLDQELGDSALKATIERQDLGPEFKNRFLDSLRVDSLAVDMGSDVWLRSTEANIALTGQVTVGKIASQYRIDGTLETPRGSYRLPIPVGLATINRDFTVTRGRVQYFGTSDLNAVLNVDAQHVVRTTKGENVNVFVNIGGTLYVPKLTLTSDVRPAISQTEIMSYLLVGAPSLGASGGAVNRAASEGVGILSGALENTLISDLKVPLDYLAIRTGDAAAGTEIAAGWQLTRDVFLTVSPRLCPGQSAYSNIGGSVEYRFSREWRLAFSRDPVHGCDFLLGPGALTTYQMGLDLFWEKSY